MDTTNTQNSRETLDREWTSLGPIGWAEIDREITARTGRPISAADWDTEDRRIAILREIRIWKNARA